ncbi:hypothetical protein [Marinomonas fungiae]|uniref:Uncharacterized protein n=1 Tax=Marinomonas fungiae TaxID=1137284 RepID=A0A0K6IUV1_9GAMM|nr:hypothetical protein [Marinomonas fungiae]CUB07077.1 hypothetical protein Ga0061065_1345 [Marinomonas fungiae]
MNISVFTSSLGSISALRQAFSSLELNTDLVVTIEHVLEQPSNECHLTVFHSTDDENTPFSPTSRKQLLLTGQCSAREIHHALSIAFAEFDYEHQQFSDENYIALEMVPQ